MRRLSRHYPRERRCLPRSTAGAARDAYARATCARVAGNFLVVLTVRTSARKHSHGSGSSADEAISVGDYQRMPARISPRLQQAPTLPNGVATTSVECPGDIGASACAPAEDEGACTSSAPQLPPPLPPPPAKTRSGKMPPPPLPPMSGAAGTARRARVKPALPMKQLFWTRLTQAKAR